MPKTYHHGRMTHLMNRAMTALTRAGLVPHAAVLTVTGRTSGLPRSTPVTAIEQGGAVWLVSPYGTVSWVRNARASGEVTLTKRRTTRRFAVREASPDEAGPVLKRYVEIAPIVLPYFIARRDDAAEAFAAEADRHPVFQLIPVGEGSVAR
ncbi:nitroreductase family deazaflavin-dependent oxidoreductase [Agromyces aerolatus]|uniref:nitroreductase family deazaflavin-dependent oxidoreductase n=1 Tax=Agromyces sp. LY-1074 TaxID=3074080 RepID=UPI0028563BA9|nr:MULTISPECIES: nitroreductase family deazaflavin-dependent oxidoreductase [unclassified Agromyces]MDR5699589.1 nitroreductase family deazaflavin-dependent oxidoreductase [Agromyces sp. LY-1074]MDR5705885.1 nitroreductase family deazaflavin-dependent oxidoreductase [Agromyces sp. LY-1358]